MKKIRERIHIKIKSGKQKEKNEQWKDRRMGHERERGGREVGREKT